VHCPDCLLQPSEFEGILGVFSDYVKKFNVSVYDETKHKGILRHIYIRKGSASGEIMVCAVINGKTLPAEVETEVVPDVRITLADEDFVLFIDKNEGGAK
jgi:23S rRNA (uracil1939-C5)-methyltransferase